MSPFRFTPELALRLLAFGVVSIVAGAVLAAALIPIAAVGAAAATSAVRSFESLPQRIVTPDLPQSTILLAQDGSVLASLYFQNRVTVPLSQVSPTMRQAIVAIEDARFYEHRGVDVRGTARAILSNYFGDGGIQGGSTITQQYVKNVLVETARSPEEARAAREISSQRKLREMRLALELERALPKDEILERYLNIAYFGASAYGIEAAARRYFSKSAADLDLAESATLAGIVQSPGIWDPLKNPGNSQKRRSQVLSRMVANGFITREEAEEADSTDLADILAPSRVDNGCVTSTAPFFCDYVLQSIRNDPLFGDDVDAREQLLRQGGLVIRTTLDLQAQSAADASVRSWIPIDDESRKAAAISMIEPGSGNVIAMAQNRDWGASGEGRTALNYNVGRDYNGIIGAQAGSTFKVFTIAAALEQGLSPFELIDSPQRKEFQGFTNCQSGAPFEPYPVQNSTRSGKFDMPTATAYSVNTYFVELELRTGLCDPVRIAKAMGLEHGDGADLEAVPSFTLGVAPVTPLAMAEAYATFAAHGVHCEPRAILSMTNRAGTPIQVRERSCKRAMARPVADAVTSMLRGVIDGNIPGRTGARMSLGRDAAGKTGTINENAAVWFVGYTPELSAAVWVGDPRGGQAYPLQNLRINGTYYTRVFGGTIPGPIWRESMLGALKGRPAQKFDLQLDLLRGSRQQPEISDEPTTATTRPPTTSAPAVTTSPPAPVSPTPGATSSPTPTATPRPTTSSPRPTTSPTTSPTSSPAPTTTSASPVSSP
jgi:membrane peptidoglycan carboxypeptidase